MLCFEISLKWQRTALAFFWATLCIKSLGTPATLIQICKYAFPGETHRFTLWWNHKSIVNQIIAKFCSDVVCMAFDMQTWKMPQTPPEAVQLRGPNGVPCIIIRTQYLKVERRRVERSVVWPIDWQFTKRNNFAFNQKKKENTKIIWWNCE